ncbi:MAG: hypothetical protein E6J75_05675 [Deltaproteobacteria bacterium]|nr:MAG: hypothetical protein E6J79_09520 [Deltaproteobacteria bacterium]TMA58316.1 MAG: hypothetical protein E6J75_05675 [Deltaproteobacteria bacterium]
MSGARLAAHAVRLLGPVEGPVAIAVPPRLGAHLGTHLSAAAEGDVPTAAVVAFLGSAPGPAKRQALLAALRNRLPVGAPIVLLDHSQPRAPWRRAIGALHLAARGLWPSRARYPAARELAALGFTVERLRLACGERAQLVVARRPAP